MRFQRMRMTIRGDRNGQDMAAFAAGFGASAATGISLGSSRGSLLGGLLLLIGP